MVEGVERITVREAVSRYITGGRQEIAAYASPALKIAVASHGGDLEARLSPKGEVCTSFVLVDPATMTFETVRVEPGDSPEHASVNAVRAAAKSGASVVITPAIRPACCTALRALAIAVALADESLTVRDAIEAYRRDELIPAPYV